MKVKCWDKMTSPMRKVWTKLSKKFGHRKNAEHMKLQQDVSSCEYEDVHVLWEMLKRHDVDLTGSPKDSAAASFWDVLQWAKNTPLICHTSAD
ncbi:hypothetical protein ACS0TY_024084 [Phlomoides rotata]